MRLITDVAFGVGRTQDEGVRRFAQFHIIQRAFFVRLRIAPTPILWSDKRLMRSRL
jgi:hypothetical protein